MLDKVGMLEECAHDYIYNEATTSPIVASAMSTVFAEVNYKPNRDGGFTTSKAKLKARLMGQLAKVLAAKAAPPKKRGFDINDYLPENEKEETFQYGGLSFQGKDPWTERPSEKVKPPTPETELERLQRELREMKALLAKPETRKTAQPDVIACKLTKLTPSAADKYPATVNIKVWVGKKATSYKLTFGGDLTTYDKIAGQNVVVDKSKVLTSDVRKELALAWERATMTFANIDQWL